ncbi:hypothetical protein GCM10022221_62980 [Actinocorallia aurea]
MRGEAESSLERCRRMYGEAVEDVVAGGLCEEAARLAEVAADPAY